LAHRLGRARITAEAEAAEEIIASCARLPLALAIVAARAAIHPHFPLQALADELRDSRTRLDTNVRAVFSWSYDQLTPEAARLFRLLGLHPGPDISAPAAASLAGTPRPPLLELTRAHLVSEHAPGRYTFHDLLRAYAAELAHTDDPDTEQRAATHRLLDHYLHTAHTAARMLNPTRDTISLSPPRDGVAPEDLTDHAQAMAWFATEHPVLLAALDLDAIESGFDTHIWQLTWTLDTFLDRRGHWHDQAAAWRIAMDATQRLGDRPAQSRAHRGLAAAYITLDRFEEAHAHLQHALDLCSELGNQAGKAHTHRVLGTVFEQQGRHTEALDHAQQALHLFQTAEHRIGQARALNDIGWYHAQLGQHEQALTACEQALALHRGLGNRNGQAATWDSLGYVHYRLGEFDHAISCYQHSLDLDRELGNRYVEAETLIHLGDTHHATGDHDAARHTWQQALEILDELDHPDARQVRAKLHQLDQP
jgi:tetratricopeptide (TPR) repeat protein